MIRCVVNSLFDAMQKKLNSEVEIGGVDDIVNAIDQAIRDSQPVLGEVNSLTDTILTILTTIPHQPQYDFGNHNPQYYSVIVSSIYALSADFLIKPMIKKEMISELTSQYTNAENDDGQPYNYDTKTINNLISQSNQQIDKAVNHIFDTYLKDKELDVLYNLEDDWFREFIYDETVNIIDILHISP